jgi:hypothetical protein
VQAVVADISEKLANLVGEIAAVSPGCRCAFATLVLPERRRRRHRVLARTSWHPRYFGGTTNNLIKRPTIETHQDRCSSLNP